MKKTIKRRIIVLEAEVPESFGDRELDLWLRTRLRRQRTVKIEQMEVAKTLAYLVNTLEEQTRWTLGSHVERWRQAEDGVWYLVFNVRALPDGQATHLLFLRPAEGKNPQRQWKATVHADQEDLSPEIARLFPRYFPNLESAQETLLHWVCDVHYRFDWEENPES